MPLYSKESLEALRQRIDLVEALAPHLEMKKAGASYKALCPFHDEKTPSLMIQKGDSHYHCYGCGAHGDAIQFLMSHLKMSFTEAVESLAQRFNIHLEQVEKGNEQPGLNKAILKEALEYACQFFHFYLLYSQEGQQALQYLYSRGIELNFIQSFQIGLSPNFPGLLRKFLHSKSISDSVMMEAGLLSPSSSGGFREFFQNRIMFPIRSPLGDVIAFSGRKYREETFGGKYVNTPETPLFKKSRVLFGLNYSRKRIAKERKVLIVEGQLDALRLIYHGFNITVAGQGTAFGEGHAKELTNLGVNHVFLAMDGDEAGCEAACKIGNIFQQEGVEVSVIGLPPNGDPDTFLCEEGPEAFTALMEQGKGYLDFLVSYRSRSLNMDSPAIKNELVQSLTKQIRSWNQPLMVHESLRKLAHLTQVPESAIGINQDQTPNIFIKRSASIEFHAIDSDKILEYDVIRWLLLVGEVRPQLVATCEKNLTAADFRVSICQTLYTTYLEKHKNKACDLLSLVASIEEVEVQSTISEILARKVNIERAEPHLLEAIQKMLDRNWMEKREKIRIKIQDGQCSEEEALTLAKEFDLLRRNPPKVVALS